MMILGLSINFGEILMSFGWIGIVLRSFFRFRHWFFGKRGTILRKRPLICDSTEPFDPCHTYQTIAQRIVKLKHRLRELCPC